MNLRLQLLFVAASTFAAFQATAASPPPEQLLPPDTVAVFTIPDWEKAYSFQNTWPLADLSRDPSMRPFKENFIKQFKSEILLPLEREMGIKLADYTSLLKGQLTVAMVPKTTGAKPGSAATSSFLLIVDAKNQKDQLKERLASAKALWVKNGKNIKTLKLQNIEFSTIELKSEDLSKLMSRLPLFGGQAEPDEPSSPDTPSDETSKSKVELTFGQSAELLIVSTDPSVIEKVLVRQSGGAAPALAAQANYQPAHAALFKDALGFGWINFKPIFELLSQTANSALESGDTPPIASPSKILSATGLGNLQTISLKLSGAPDGALLETFFAIPESQRRGLFNLFAIEAKDASPPPIIPATAVKFDRWRVDGKKTWAALEALVSSISPEMAGFIQMGLASAGKDKDPNFDLKRNLIGNLGNDFISFEKAPQTSALADLEAPPAIMLIGSPNPEQFAQALKAATAFLPFGASPDAIQERDFLGRKIYSMNIPGLPTGADEEPADRTFSFAAAGGYIGMTTEPKLLEEHLRTGESSPKSLRDTPGLAEAAQKVGGMATGVFGFENQRETMRAVLTALKNNADDIDKLFNSGEEPGGDEESFAVSDWLDFSLLPPFDQISKYFYFIVYSITVKPEGYSWRLFSPNSPQLK